MRLFRMLFYLGEVRRVSRGAEKLFDSQYYLECNPDVAATRMWPLLHFLIFGAFERRKPNRLFDPQFYLRKYPDIAAAEINPLLHYLTSGAAEGRSPHPLFDADPGENAANLPRFLSSLQEPPESVLYSWWLRLESRTAIPEPAVQLRFTILVAVCRPRCEWLEQAITSIRTQDYDNWEISICASGITERPIQRCLDRAAQSDQRIRVTRTDRQASTDVALKQAAAFSTGDYLLVLGEEDCLAPNALRWLASKAPADVIYSDEDHVNAESARAQPLFKPDWSPELLLSCPYLGRIMAISRATWHRVGGIRPEYRTAWEYDLALRATENTLAVSHVPRVLYSRRIGETADPLCNEDVRRCLMNAVERRAISADVESDRRTCSFRIHRKATQTEVVSIIICTRSAHLLERCLASLAARTSYELREIIVVQHLSGKPVDVERIIARFRAMHLTYSGNFHYSRMNNMASEAARGGILLFLNDDTETIEESWLERLVAQVERPDVGIAGARLLYPSGALQHGGVVIGVGDGCAHVGRNTSVEPAHWPWLGLTREVSAVTGACMAVRTDVFRGLGGFADDFPVNYNDIDLCMRARRAGYRVIYEAAAVVCHYECQSRPGLVTPAEREQWQNRWGDAPPDPFYSPALSREHEDLSLGALGSGNGRSGRVQWVDTDSRHEVSST